jgi:hypothetical protein
MAALKPNQIVKTKNGNEVRYLLTQFKKGTRPQCIVQNTKTKDIYWIYREEIVGLENDADSKVVQPAQPDMLSTLADGLITAMFGKPKDKKK